MTDPQYHDDFQAQAGPSRYRPTGDDRQFNLTSAEAVIADKGKQALKRQEESDYESWTVPTAFNEGVFKGKVVRFLLKSVQEPVSGRRKTEKDRRPLAPVPILRLWVKECCQDAQGLWSEEYIDPSGIDPSCLLCEAEIRPTYDWTIGSIVENIPTRGPLEGDNVPLFDSSSHITSEGQTDDLARPPWTRYESYSGRDHPGLLKTRQYIEPEQLRYHPPDLRHRASWVSDGHWDTRSALLAPPQDSPVQHSYRLSGNLAPAAAAGRSRKVTEADMGSSDDDMEGTSRVSKKSRVGADRNLYGALHVSGIKVVAPTGEQAFWFLFTDLSVRHEGTYDLRFRVFDISIAKPEMPPVPALADCQSGTFKVYSPRSYAKSFPGMPKPTELSEHFIKQGYKLNTRKNERLAKSPSPPSPRPERGDSPASAGQSHALSQARATF